MARIQHSKEWHEEEYAWIANAWPMNAGQFRNNQAVFNEYIEMQAESAALDGYPDIAKSMLGCREAVPMKLRIKR